MENELGFLPVTFRYELQPINKRLNYFSYSFEPINWNGHTNRYYLQSHLQLQKIKQRELLSLPLFIFQLKD